MSDLATELHTACRLCGQRRHELLSALRDMADAVMRAHSAVSQDQWPAYEQAQEDMANCRLRIGLTRARLEVALRHEEKLHRRAIDWALMPTGEGRQPA